MVPLSGSGAAPGDSLHERGAAERDADGRAVRGAFEVRAARGAGDDLGGDVARHVRIDVVIPAAARRVAAGAIRYIVNDGLLATIAELHVHLFVVERVTA